MGYLMKRCKINENHWYSNHLSYCPWCKIANETGKDPFPSSTGQKTFGSQIPVSSISGQSPKLFVPKSNLTSQGTNPPSKKPASLIQLNISKKKNAVPYKTIFVGIILCLLAFVGNALINGNDDSSNNLQDISQDVSTSSKNPMASNGDGTNSIDTITELEQTLPIAYFSADTTYGEAPLKVQFTDESTGSPTSWNWNFGDRVVSTDQNPVHTYLTAGTYTVKETVTNEAGKDIVIKERYVTVTAPAEILVIDIPDADFSASQTTGEAPLTVSFTDESMGSPTEWKWNFGDGSPIIDGTTSAYQNPTHTYEEAGVYEVKETAINSAGRDTETKTGYITVISSVETPVIDIPDADFSASQTTGEAPLTVSFTDESMGSPTEWKWNFGDGSPIIDGTTSAYQNPTHTYEEAGVYEVKETAINSAGRDTETKTGYITVT
jgi:PKD repeat protein